MHDFYNQKRNESENGLFLVGKTHKGQENELDIKLYLL